MTEEQALALVGMHPTSWLELAEKMSTSSWDGRRAEATKIVLRLRRTGAASPPAAAPRPNPAVSKSAKTNQKIDHGQAKTVRAITPPPIPAKPAHRPVMRTAQPPRSTPTTTAFTPSRSAPPHTVDHNSRPYFPSGRPTGNNPNFTSSTVSRKKPTHRPAQATTGKTTPKAQKTQKTVKPEKKVVKQVKDQVALERRRADEAKRALEGKILHQQLMAPRLRACESRERLFVGPPTAPLPVNTVWEDKESPIAIARRDEEALASALTAIRREFGLSGGSEVPATVRLRPDINQLDQRIRNIRLQLSVDHGHMTSMDPLATGHRTLETRVRRAEQLLVALQKTRKALEPTVPNSSGIAP